jgi:4-amino-4-deoxy-L-arabinose transferase-like glycosyltransferase
MLDGASGRRPWRWLVGVQIAALLVCGVTTVARFHIWAPVDERAHYAYVQEIAEHGRLPRIDDVVSWQVQAITDNTWPRRSDRDPAQLGLTGRNYEAFQPPLYYLLATPVFAVVPDHRDKVFALRGFDFALLAVAALLLFFLARAQLPEAPLVAYSAALTVVLWPGVLARGITASNLPLEMVLVAALFLSLTRAEQRGDTRALLAAGVLLGACLLTKTTLVCLVVPFALVLARNVRAAPRATLAAAVLPGVVLAPWLISNVVRLGTLTANNAAQRQQTPLLYPQGNTFGLDDVPDRLRHLYDGVLPLEWAGQLDVAWVTAAVLLLIVPLLLGALASIRSGRPLVLLPGSALVAGLLIAVVTAIAAHWDIFLLRYLYAVLPALAIAVAATLYRTAGASVITAGVCVHTVVLGALWLDMAGAFYFTNVGRALGI